VIVVFSASLIFQAYEEFPILLVSMLYASSGFFLSCQYCGLRSRLRWCGFDVCIL